VKIHRLQKDGLIEKTGEFKEDGVIRIRYKKTGRIMLS
jgi:DNA-binding PadR family transcriptional regulator